MSTDFRGSKNLTTKNNTSLLSVARFLVFFERINKKNLGVLPKIKNTHKENA